MSAKEQLLNELEHAPDAMVEQILDFCLFLKQRQQAKAETSRPHSLTHGDSK
ncbi:MAG: hypothetical protein HY785_26500 [Oscillatoriophycideae cyanobacterium NC_groundwater_1537_Pr4_S-0.65um_50_18]|nr:hypothetical protein [Oscillatoriophycideae cyanobacterium NC_groundwater_1537_Pr4_S-0.65um_50_18]